MLSFWQNVVMRARELANSLNWRRLFVFLGVGLALLLLGVVAWSSSMVLAKMDQASFNVGDYLLANFLNGLVVLGLFPVGALVAVLVLHIVTKLTPWKLQNAFEKGISGGALLLCCVILGLCWFLGAAVW